MNMQRFSELVEKAQKLRKLNELYNKVINLHNLGIRSYKISKILEVEDGIRIHPDTIRKWYQGLSHPFGKCNAYREGPELAYVTSAWLGDGTLNENKLTASYDIILRTIDLDFATRWGESLGIALNRKPYRPFWDKDHNCWAVVGRSLLLATLLIEIAKSPSLIMPLFNKYPAEALRGIFDSEGCISQEKHRYRITASNYNSELLEIYKALLEKHFDIESKITKEYIRGKRIINPKTEKVYFIKQDYIYVLVIEGKEYLRKFYHCIGFTAARKAIILKEKIKS